MSKKKLIRRYGKRVLTGELTPAEARARLRRHLAPDLPPYRRAAPVAKSAPAPAVRKTAAGVAGVPLLVKQFQAAAASTAVPASMRMWLDSTDPLTRAMGEAAAADWQAGRTG